MTEFVSGSIYIRVMGEGGMGLKPGEIVGGHTHNFDHTSIFFCGRWRVRKWKPDSEEAAFDFERDGPFHVLIEKDCRHAFQFLGGAPVGWAYCVYSHRTPQGDISLVETGWPDAFEASDGPPDWFPKSEAAE
jgi:hypothetical protein